MINAREEAAQNAVVTVIFFPIVLDVLIKIILIPAAFPVQTYKRYRKAFISFISSSTDSTSGYSSDFCC